MTAMTDTSTLRVGDRLRCIELTEYARLNDLVIGGEYLFTARNNSGNTIRVSDLDGTPTPHNSWIDKIAFELVVDNHADIPAVTDIDGLQPIPDDVQLHVGQKLVLLTKDEIVGTSHPCDYFADSDNDNLTVGLVYTITALEFPDIIVGTRFRVSPVGRCDYWHTHRRFALYEQEIKIGTKLMPQVISNCDIGNIEKSIFQAIADKKKKDVYIYDMKGVYHNHTGDTDNIHLYFNCLNANYCGRESGTSVSNWFAPENSYVRDYHSNRILTKIPLLYGEINLVINNTMFLNGDFIHSVTDKSEDYNRIQYLLYVAHRFGVSSITFESADDLISSTVVHQTIALQGRNDRLVLDIMAQIRELELSIGKKHKQIKDISITRYYNPDDKSDMLNNIRRLPNIVNVSVCIEEGVTHIIVKTKPLIVHLPHGDIPCGSITISIRWADSPSVTITGEYAIRFHPHYGTDPCWGGFDSMITKLLAFNDFDTLIEIIMQWHGAYDGSGVYAAWYKRLEQPEVGIIIEEGFYMSGEDEDE